MLKNIGFVCPGCSSGRHYDCDIERDPTLKMCLCFYTTHPYMDKAQLTKPTENRISLSPLVPVVGSTDSRSAGPAPRLGIRGNQQVSHDRAR